MMLHNFPPFLRPNVILDGPINELSIHQFLYILGGKALTKEFLQSIPVQRVGTKEDIANTVLYVVSDAAQLLTGTTIIADGGAWLTSDNNMNRMRRIAELHAKMW